MKCLIIRSVTGLYTKTGLLKALSLVKKDGHGPVPIQNFYKGNPSNLRKIITDVSKFEFLMKPSLAISQTSRDIPDKHCHFWSRLSIDELHGIYKALCASSSRVLSMIEDPKCLTQNQERIYGYLRMLIGNMNIEELQAFTRFVTGASTLLVFLSMKWV